MIVYIFIIIFRYANRKMKLIIENFGTIVNRTFNVPDEYVRERKTDDFDKRLVNLATLFAIRGSMVKGQPKAVRSVTLETKKLIITRTQNPTQLFVLHKGEEYEDGEGQDVIDTIMPEWKLETVMDRLEKEFQRMNIAERMTLSINFSLLTLK